MRVLVVVSGNHERVAPFVVEQAEALQKAGCDIQMFLVEGHGAHGYLRNLGRLKTAIRQFHPDVVHAHFGLCGLICTLQHKVPVVVTYHGSDINDRRILPLSRIAMRCAAHNIFVSRRLMEKAYLFSQRRRQQVNKSTSQQVNKSTRKRSRGFEVCSSVIPCGVDTTIFHPILREEACRIMQLDPAKHYVLFAGAFDNEVKNPKLAKEACALVPEITLLELKGYKRTEVAMLMNAVDCLLMTSHSEGSPQVVKEALACGCPIVSVDVGDVKEITNGIEGCYIATDDNAATLSMLLCKSIQRHERATGLDYIIRQQLDNPSIAHRLVSLYNRLNIN